MPRKAVAHALDITVGDIANLIKRRHYETIMIDKYQTDNKQLYQIDSQGFATILLHLLRV